MLRAGDVLENPVTGERAVVRVGTEESGGKLLVADLHVRPGGAVMGEHLHPAMEESFTVARGRLGYRLSGREGVAGSGERLHLPHGAVHDWWNAGEEEAQVLVEISPAVRFEEMIRNAYGLAQDGKTDAKGQPHLLQAALFAREFDDVIRFTSPPRPAQRLLFGVLASIAWLLGYRGSYPKYLGSLPSRPGGPAPRPVGAAADESRGEEAPEDEKARA
jgi:quercetin dioxygenase-like cupin family protein